MRVVEGVLTAPGRCSSNPCSVPSIAPVNPVLFRPFVVSVVRSFVVSMRLEKSKKRLQHGCRYLCVSSLRQIAVMRIDRNVLSAIFLLFRNLAEHLRCFSLSAAVMQQKCIVKVFKSSFCRHCSNVSSCGFSGSSAALCRCAICSALSCCCCWVSSTTC